MQHQSGEEDRVAVASRRSEAEPGTAVVSPPIGPIVSGPLSRFHRVATAAGAEQAPPTRPAIQVVPRAGLPFAAAAVVGLNVVIAGDWLWGIEFFHVVGGGAWTTLDLFLGFVLGPIIGRMSLPGRAEFSA